MVHCLGAFFFFFIWSCFLGIFLASNSLIMLYNIRYWWFFFSQGNWWTKYLTHPKIRRLKLCLLMWTSLVSGVKWWIHVFSIVIYLRKNSFLLPWNSCKQRSESSTHCFWSPVSKRGTYFEHSFLIDKCSCKMVNTLPSYIFNSSAISRNFNLRSTRTSFFMFSGTTAEFGRSESSASFVSVQMRLKSAYNLLTVVSNGAESE